MLYRRGLCFFPVHHADDRLGMRSYHRGPLFRFPEDDPLDRPGTAFLSRREDDTGRDAGEEQRQRRREDACLSGKDLLLQGIATSIDALSVGFAIAEYALVPAFLASLIIAAVTFIICIGGLLIGRRAGTALSWKASVLGGCILVLIGIEIFLKNL